jgi:hypothetical protein
MSRNPFFDEPTVLDDDGYFESISKDDPLAHVNGQTNHTPYSDIPGPEQNDDQPSYADRIRARLVDTAGLRQLPPPAPLIDRWLNLNSLAVLYGPSGAGKSFVALDMAAHIAECEWWHTYNVTRTGVLYVAAEGVSGMGQRARAWEEHYGVEPRITWHPGAINLFDLGWSSALAEVIAEMRPGLVVIDTYHRAMVGADENSARDTGLVVANLDQIREAAGSCVLLVHHTGKDTTKGARGSSALKAAADTELEVTGSEGRVLVNCTKQKDGPEPYPMVFRMTAAADSVALEADATLGTVGRQSVIDEITRCAAEACRDAGEPLTMRRLIGRMDVKAGRDAKIAGIEEAVACGQITETPGPNRSRMFEHADQSIDGAS